MFLPVVGVKASFCYGQKPFCKINISPFESEQFAKLNSPANGSVGGGLPAINRETVIEETKKTVMEQLKRTIRPEFLNRIDETIMFEPLTQVEIRQVVQLQVASVQKMLGQNGITLNLTDAAIDLLTREGYDPEFGARPVKRAIQRLLLNDLSRAILAGSVNRDHPILVDADGDHLTFS